jgi:peroxiredoxin Q/BCP
MKKPALFLGILSAILIFSMVKAQTHPLAIGDTCPRFSLPDQNDSLVNMKDLIGKKILVIYFYPKDESLVCTREACAFRDNFEAFKKLGAIVIGVNYGTVKSHKDFSEKDKLPFVLLSDSNNAVLKMFGLSGFANGRATYVVDLNGKIVFTHNAMLQGAAHAEKALEYIEGMEGKH